MTTKRKQLEELRDLIQTGRVDSRKHQRLHVTDTDGTTVPLTAEGALPAIERRLAALGDGE